MKKPTDHYKTLGVKKNASDEQIKKAFRKKAKAVHPDQNPEVNPEEIKEVNRAYEVLANPTKRERYDNGEDADQEDGQESAIRNIVTSVFESTMARCMDGNIQFKKQNIIKIMTDAISSKIQMIKTAARTAHGQKKILLDIQTRLESTKAEENFLIKVMENKLEFIDRGIANAEKNIEDHTAARIKIELYKYSYHQAAFWSGAPPVTSALWRRP